MSYSPLDGLGGSMIAGAQLGYQVGMDLRDRLNERDKNITIQKWRQYSHNLEVQVHNAKIDAAVHEYAVSYIDGIYRDTLKDRNTLAREYNDLLKLLSVANTEKKILQEKLESQSKILAMLSAENNTYKISISKKATQIYSLRYLCRNLSTAAVANEALYKFVHDELTELTGGTNNHSASGDRLKARDSAARKFFYSGKIVFEPDMSLPDVMRKFSLAASLGIEDFDPISPKKI